MAGGLERSAAGGPHALLSGGGSGGHVFPGLAIAHELRSRGWQVSWAGSQHGLEARLVPQRGLPYHTLPSRPVVGKSFAGKLRAAAALAQGAWSARRLVRRLEARVVVGTGGYVSVPAVLGARLASRPALLVEPNAAAGAANRWLSRVASAAAVAYEETIDQLRCPASVTGVPVRAEFFGAGELPPSPPLSLLLVGGSQGARQLNELLPRALARLELDAEIAVVHQAGHKNLDDARAAYAAAGIPPSSSSPLRVEVVPFLDDMPAALRAAHLVVSRAGAITLAEICAAGRPALLVPLALAGGHQVDNARRLTAAGAAEMLPPDAGADELTALLAVLLGDRDRLKSMSRAARGLSREGAAAAIADRVESLGERRSR